MKDESQIQQFLAETNPTKLFARPRIVIGSEHSKSVFVTSAIIRVDFVQDGLQCWQFPGGYSDIVELSENEFRKYAQLDAPVSRPRREHSAPAGDMLVSFTELHMCAGKELHVMIEYPNKLPAENQSFMQFMLSKGTLQMRLRGGGFGVLNLANLAAYKVYPGVAQIPSDSWLAEPVSS